MNKNIFLACCCLMLFSAPVMAADQRVAVPLENSPAFGPDNAPVTIFEFIDFQ